MLATKPYLQSLFSVELLLPSDISKKHLLHSLAILYKSGPKAPIGDLPLDNLTEFNLDIIPEKEGDEALVPSTKFVPPTSTK